MFTCELIQRATPGVPTFAEPAGGDVGQFLVNVPIFEGATKTMTIDVERRMPEDPTYATAGSFDTITTTGMYSKEVSGLKSQVRLRLTLSSGFWSCIQILPTQWKSSTST